MEHYGTIVGLCENQAQKQLLISGHSLDIASDTRIQHFDNDCNLSSRAA